MSSNTIFNTKGRGKIYNSITETIGDTPVVKLNKVAPDGSNILCMLADTGERYLSTPLFDGIEEEMSDEEIALSKSTPGYQLS